MKRFNFKKHKTRNILLILVFLFILYLVFAYNYFYYRQRSADIPWPNNEQTYVIKGETTKNKIYVALGDSLTYSFGASSYKDSYTYRLAEFFSSNVDGLTLVDLSYPGYKTKDVLEKVDLTIESNPDIITVFIGVNDTHGFIKLKDFNKNYDTILSRLSKETKAKIYVINEPYTGAKSVQLPPLSYYFDHVARTHNKSSKKLAEKYKLNYIDLYSPTRDKFKKNGPHYSKDGYHPSSLGYKIWADVIKNAIR